MEEIREVAKAYYVNLTEQQQEKARDDFEKMKLEKHKSLSLTDFLDFFPQDKYPKKFACSLFKELDSNGDGSMDFDEFITLFYLYQGKRLLYCRGCETFLSGLYFTCVKCFGTTSNSYDLCSFCYRNKNFQHHKDAVFLDNYALLRLNIKPSSETAVVQVQENNEIKKDVDESGQVNNEIKKDVDESGQVEKYENEGQIVVSELISDNQEKLMNATLANLDDSSEEKTANQEIAKVNRRRKTPRIGKAFATFGANVTAKVTTKVAGGISSAVDNATDCKQM